MAVRDSQSDPKAGGEDAEPSSAYDVFLSHNGKDKPAVRILAERLKAEGLEPYLDAWHLVPGEAWQEALEEALLTSRTCAVFLGPAGFGSWENEEMRAALSQRVRNPDFRVIPVLLPGAEFPSTGRLPAFLARTTWVDFRPGLDDAPAFERLVSGIKGIAPEEEVVDPSASINPFRGLEVFDEAHAEFFFGRDALTQQLVEQLREDRFLAVMGPSGTGKSSVVRAGLVPQLRQGALPASDTWHVTLLRPGSHPLESLAARLVPILEMPGSPVAEQGAILDVLTRDERGLHNAVTTLLAEDAVDRRVVIVVDQFEEVFAPDCDAQQRDRFVANLLYASSIAGGQTVVVLTMRADFFGKVAAIPDLAARIADRDVLVSPMSDVELREAIVKPAQRVGLEFEKGLVDTILDDLGAGPGVLPLLELTLLELWEGRRGHWLTVDRYREIDGVQGAIAKRAETAFGRLTADQQRTARRVLLRLTSPGEGTEDSRRRATLAELVPTGPDAGDARAVIDELTNARLLTTSDEPGGEVVDVAHEALIRSWPRLHQWIEEDPAGLRVHRRLTETANAWAASGKDPSDLYRGARLDEALKWASRDPEDVSESERAFLDASVAQRDREARSRERRRLIIGAGIGIAVFAVAVTAVVALVNWQQAESERQVAEQAGARATAQLALSEGQRVGQSEPSLGLRLVAEGLRRATDAGIPKKPFREELIRQLGTGRFAQLGTEVTGFELVGNGNGIAVDRGSGAGQLWNVRDGKLLTDLPSTVDTGSPPFPFPESVVRQSETLAAVELSNGFELRRLADGSLVDLPATPDEIDFVGDRVVARYPTGSVNEELGETFAGPWTAELRSAADGSLVAPIEEFSRMSVVRGSDWTSAFVERGDGIELINLADGGTIETWTNVPDVGFYFPLNRQVVAIPTTGGRCLFIRAQDGAQLLDLPGTCSQLEISQDGSIVAAQTFKSDVQVVPVAGGQPVATLPRTSTSLFLSPEAGASRIAVVDNRRVKLFETSTGRLVSDLDGIAIAPIGPAADDPGADDPPEPVAFSASGKLLLVRGPNGPVVYDTVTGRRIDLQTQDTAPDGAQPIDVILSRDPAGSYMVAQFADHAELLRGDGTLVPIGGRAQSVKFWEGADAGPILVSYLNGTAALFNWDTGTSKGLIPGTRYEVFWAYPTTPAAAAIETEEIDDPSKEAALLLVGADGTLAENPGWDFIRFSPDPEASTVIVQRANGAFELWDRTENRVLARLGLGVAYVDYTPDGTVLAVRYGTGELDLISVADLRAMPPASSMSAQTDAQLLDLACTGSVGAVVADERIEAAIGSRPAACP
jgi:conflict system STAND superfamily ATPase/TIR domain-containing protein